MGLLAIIPMMVMMIPEYGSEDLLLLLLIIIIITTNSILFSSWLAVAINFLCQHYSSPHGRTTPAQATCCSTAPESAGSGRFVEQRWTPDGKGHGKSTENSCTHLEHINFSWIWEFSQFSPFSHFVPGEECRPSGHSSRGWSWPKQSVATDPMGGAGPGWHRLLVWWDIWNILKPQRIYITICRYMQLISDTIPISLFQYIVLILISGASPLPTLLKFLGSLVLCKAPRAL